MKKLLLILSVFYTQMVISQNLVPNPSFEDTVACPIGINQVGGADGWINIRSTPDYFNSCASQLSHVSVPSNSNGYQCPPNGNAYCGFIPYATGLSNYRELLGVELLSPLLTGQKYYVSFKVSLADQSICGCNKLGALFSTVKFPLDTFGTTPLNNFAHVYSNVIITDSVNWTTINGSVIADSAYKFIIIGNFFDDSNTDTLRFYPVTGCTPYYFLDDICVSTDSIACIIPNEHNICDTTIDVSETLQNKELNEIYPNPTSGKILIDLPNMNEATINIYNLFGQLKWDGKVSGKTAVIDLFGLESGMYTIQIKQHNKIFNNKIIIN